MIKHKQHYSPTPTIMVVFGATGDLSKRKLLPALFGLHIKEFLPNTFYVGGFSRQDLSVQSFRKFIKESVAKKGHGHSEKDVEGFFENTFYQQGLFEDTDAYERLAKEIAVIDERIGMCSNKLFYLAVPPAMYEVILRNLASSGLATPCTPGQGWTRVLVEKPFGKDLKAAQKLDGLLGALFKEEQIFRIDHYLAKEALQNILTFRFSNALFEPIWNNEHIEKVHIKLLESLGVEKRGTFYNDIGALRDVGQNHILQMLALIAMENPKVLEAELVRTNRASVLTDLVSIKESDIAQSVVRGQYKGFKNEEHVDPSSFTETYFKIRAYIGSKRWKGIPFYLESGKALKEAKTEITIYFKKAPCLCTPEYEKHHQNTLTFQVQPHEGISICFWAKQPGFAVELEPKMLSFSYERKADSAHSLPDAYERILYDCIRGDQTLFASTQEVDASWKFITPILNYWEKIPLHEYEKGSEGPSLNS